MTNARTVIARTTRALRAGTMRVFLIGLRIYTRVMPWNRGRGLFIRPIEKLKRHGWPAPLISIGMDLAMEFEPSLLGWTVFQHGEWEPEQTKVILDLLKSGDVVVNVGANTGYYALFAGAAVGPAGHVYAFQIQLSIASILRRNVELNGLRERITVEEIGCFSEPGMANRTATRDRRGSGSPIQGFRFRSRLWIPTSRAVWSG